MIRRIVNMQELSEMTNTSRERLEQYIREGRLIPDYLDRNKTCYWRLVNAKAIAETIKTARQTYKKGKGRMLQIMPGIDPTTRKAKVTRMSDALENVEPDSAGN